jgi:alpha-mannosidase
MALTRDWEQRIQQWINTLPRLFYEPLERVPLKAHFTRGRYTAQQAARKPFAPIATGTSWGSKWEYGWFRTSFRIPKEAAGKRIAFRSGAGSECAIFVNGEAFGAWDREHKEITLTRNGVAGTCYELLIEAYGGHGPTPVGCGPVLEGELTMPEALTKQVTVTDTTFGIWQEPVYQLWMDSLTLWGMLPKLPKDSLRLQEVENALCEMTVAVDLELPQGELLKTVAKGRKILKPLMSCTNGSTAPDFYCVGHSHIDVAFLWPIRETESKCIRTFGTQLAMMDEYRDMTFIQSQPYLYTSVKENCPQLYERIRKAVKTGRWIPEGGMWVEADSNIPGGESLIRQFLYGKRFFQEEFGVDNHLLWLPDVFGYSGALPQIMRGCGVEYFATCKLSWAVGRHQPFPYHSFWWQGIDGTRVFAHVYTEYASSVDSGTMIERWNTRRQRDKLTARLVPYGHGDGGGGPTRDHLEFIKRQRDLEGAPRLRHASPLDFFRDEEKEPDWMPTYVGELYFQNHRGTYTSQAKTKQGNRKSEVALREAELWAAFASAQADRTFPLAQLEALWKTVLVNQFHDILPGSSIARVHEEANREYAAVVQSASEISARAVRALAGKGRKGLTIFNSLSWQREALVTLPEKMKGAVTEQGDALPSQVVQGRTVVQVKDIPSCGWLSLQAADPVTSHNPLKATPTLLENEHLRVRINNRGALTSIYDKDHERELTEGTCNQFALYKDVPFNFDCWNIDVSYRDCPVSLPEKAKVTVIEKGPVRAALRVKRTLNRSALVQEIRLEAGSRKVEFVTTIDWQEKHKLLKVNFPVSIHAIEALHEIQFGHLARPAHESNDHAAAQFEVCQQKWTALCDNGHGVALLNDCKYGISVQDNVLGLTLLKSGLAPDMNADRGLQTCTYSFYAWDGPFSESGVVRKGYELNTPVQAAPGRGGTASLLSLDRPNVIVETVKLAEDGSGDMIVRLYEAMRKKTYATLKTSLTLAKVFCTNMLEHGSEELKCTAGSVSLTFRPFEIKTLRLVV